MTSLRSQAPRGLLGVDGSPIRLRWQIETPTGTAQDGYEIQMSMDRDFSSIASTTGTVRSHDQVGVVAPGSSPVSREVRFYRVRILAGREWSDWSVPFRVEAGLLEPDDWIAQAITLAEDDGSERQSPSPILRREFHLGSAPAAARLHVTSLGVHSVFVNGQPATDDLLAPGWTSYRHRLLSSTHDVVELLSVGDNVIAGILGDGWYRGRLGWESGDDRCRYGQEVALIAQLEIRLADGTDVFVATDETWRAATGRIVSADLYDGSVIDTRRTQAGWMLPGFDASRWSSAAAVPFATAVVTPRMVSPVRALQTWPARELSREGQRTIYDIGQNIAGYLRVEAEGTDGHSVTVRHAEVLESDGSLHVRSLRTARATDTYILGGPTDGDVLQPDFTFHGFRYASIDSDADVKAVTAVAIGTDMDRRSAFECSMPLLNRLHENVVWSMRDNFVSVPTDCPQRDERLGWTGDAQAFAATSCTLFDSEAFWANWLKDLASDQDPTLGVSTVVPDVVVDGEPRFGRAGWADAATIIPWAVYESYGDVDIVREQFDSMRSWVASLTSRTGSDGLVEPGMQFGDWLDPDAPPARPWEAKADPQFLANAFFAHSARLTADAAIALGADDALVSELAQLSEAVASATWKRWREHIVETQTGAAIALRFSIVPESHRQRVVDELARLVDESAGAIATGFLGTPHVLHALAEGGRFDEAFTMLLRQEYPSWLYQVTKGATTVWERWDAIRPDGSIHPGTMDPLDPDGESGHMLSFNHYAYGAVVDWIYRHVAGIAPDRSHAGYRRVIVAPQPVEAIEWVESSIDSRYGTIRCDWELDGSKALDLELTIPSGVSAAFTAPVRSTSKVLLDGSEVDGPTIDLGPGRHSLAVQQPHIHRPRSRS